VAGKGLTQRNAAEFLEDWTDNIRCLDSGEIPTSKAIGAIRRLTIENARKVTSEVKQLAESRSAFEQVEAKSEDPIPELVYFKCKPYSDLQERTFVLRVAVLTTEQPAIKLHIRQHEEHIEQMAQELADVVGKAASEHAQDATVVLGKYQRA
jgi:uncharacterized protein YfdQ (DUF2303 family)